MSTTNAYQDRFIAEFTLTANNFKRAYAHFNPDVAKAENNINRGDCGVFALAVGHVLSTKYGLPIGYIDNLNHGFIRLLDASNELDCFDSINYKGTTLEELNYIWASDVVNELDFAGMVEAYMPCDVKGAYMIKALCDIEGVQVPNEIAQLIHNELEYELSEWVEKYRNFHAAATAA